MKDKDLEFLKEMKTLSEGLLNDRYDVVKLESLDQMIGDWIHELSTPPQPEGGEKVEDVCPNCKEALNAECACFRNKCNDCGAPVGNITFTVCDKCWDKAFPNKPQPAPNAAEQGGEGKEITGEKIRTILYNNGRDETNYVGDYMFVVKDDDFPEIVSEILSLVISSPPHNTSRGTASDH